MCGRYYSLFDKQQAAEHFHVRRTADNVGIIAPNYNVAPGDFHPVIRRSRCCGASGAAYCHSPHRGLLEMYRVARRGVLAFEPRDTRLVRLGVRLGFGQEYEIAAVAENGLRRFDQTLPKARI